MKKLLTLFVLLSVLCVFASCNGENNNYSSGSVNEKNDMSILNTPPTSDSQSNNNQDGSKVTETENEEINLEITFRKEKVECYTQLELGKYEGRDFLNLGYGAYYRVIDTYEELCLLTEKGSSVSEAIFDTSVVLVLNRYEGCEDIGRIGYKNFVFEGEKAKITLYDWKSSFHMVDAMEWNETVYLKIPKEDMENIGNTIGGEITIERDTVELLDAAQISADNTKVSLGTVKLIDGDKLDDFLKENNITDRLNWMYIYGSSIQDYRILVICHNSRGINSDYSLTKSYESIGYGDLNINGTDIEVTRFYNVESDEKANIIEFVAIPKTQIGEGGYTNITLNETEYEIKTIPYEKSIEETVVVDVPKYEYYNFIELGIYYYDNQLPSGSSYHIITSKNELEIYVENSYLEESFFDDNYIVVLRIENSNNLDAFGIRDLRFNKEGKLVASMETGAERYKIDTEELVDIREEMFESSLFQAEYFYITVKKSDFYFNENNQNKIGNLEINITDYEKRGGYNTEYYNPNMEYSVEENSAWIITNIEEAEKFYAETGIYLGRKLEEGKFLFVYYGNSGYSILFDNFISENSNVYIDMSCLYAKEDYEPLFYVVSIDLTRLNCTSKKITAHITKYTQTKAGKYVLPEKIWKELESFNVSHYGGQNLIKVTSFDYQIIKDEEGYKNIISEYTRLTEYPSVDFENSVLVAYYQYEPCTACPSSTKFGNIHVGNGIMYIDKAVESHIGGAAMNPTLYFIVIEKEYFDTEPHNICLIEGRYYLQIDR